MIYILSLELVILPFMFHLKFMQIDFLQGTYDELFKL